jgi:hypothetical protein
MSNDNDFLIYLSVFLSLSLCLSALSSFAGVDKTHPRLAAQILRMSYKVV